MPATIIQNEILDEISNIHDEVSSLTKGNPQNNK